MSAKFEARFKEKDGQILQATKEGNEWTTQLCPYNNESSVICDVYCVHCNIREENDFGYKFRIAMITCSGCKLELPLENEDQNDK